MNNDKKITLNIIKVNQPIGEFYVSKISPSDLLRMSTVDRRRIEDDDEILGIQRELKQEKVSQIRNYLISSDATFPNSIILNTESEYIENLTDNQMTIRISPTTFTILDGQHRVEGFRDNNHSDFELIVAIFKDLRPDQQADIFSTINSEQTKVDPSLNLNLELNSTLYTPKKMMIEIAQSFEYDQHSPWYNSIKMLGNRNQGIISLAAFVRPLLDLTYPEKDYYLIRNELKESAKSFPSFEDFAYNTNRYIFWSFYKKQDFKSVYKILFNYFEATKNVFITDWLNENSLLCKTTGYNAMIRLFKYLYPIGIKESTLTYDFFFNKIKCLNILDGQINTLNFGASGLKASDELYKRMLELVTNQNP